MHDAINPPDEYRYLIKKIHNHSSRLNMKKPKECVSIIFIEPNAGLLFCKPGLGLRIQSLGSLYWIWSSRLSAVDLSTRTWELTKVLRSEPAWDCAKSRWTVSNIYIRYVATAISYINGPKWQPASEWARSFIRTLVSWTPICNESTWFAAFFEFGSSVGTGLTKPVAAVTCPRTLFTMTESLHQNSLTLRLENECQRGTRSISGHHMVFRNILCTCLCAK